MKKIPYLWLMLVALTACQPRELHFRRAANPAQAWALAARQDRPVLLYGYSEGCVNRQVLEREVFTDAAVVEACHEAFTLVSADLADDGWREFALEKDLGRGPALLWLTTDGCLINGLDVTGGIGLNALGELGCRKAVLRQCRLAEAFAEPDDSLYFSPARWADCSADVLRLDGGLFRRMVLAKDFLKRHYPGDYVVTFDYAMSCAAVSLVDHGSGRPTVDSVLAHTYYYVVDSLPIDWPGRYRLYADINIALGLDDMENARRVAQQAFDRGDIRELEYRQLMSYIR